MYKKIILGVVLMTVSAIGYNALSHHSTPVAQTIRTTPSTQSVAAAVATALEAPKPPKTSTHITASASTTPPVAHTTSNLTFSVAGTTYPLHITGTETVLNAMQQLASTTSFTYIGKEHPGMGLFIESINGTKNTDGQYWFLYVNGYSASHGVSTQTISPGDRVEWKYEGGY